MTQLTGGVVYVSDSDWLQFLAAVLRAYGFNDAEVADFYRQVTH
jgi:hypothetical protein